MKKKCKKNKFGKKIVFVLELEPYNQNCIVICNGTFNDAIKIFKKNKINSNALASLKEIESKKDDYPADFKVKKDNGTLFTKLPAGYVMMFNHQDGWISTVGTVAHEVIHLSHYVLQKAGLMLSSDSEEAFTYFSENVLEKILRKIY
jgi:hypothetical protein